MKNEGVLPLTINEKCAFFGDAFKNVEYYEKTFGIHPAYSTYKDSRTELKRQNDIYVFCLNTGINEEESNPLDMANWEFYVVPTATINEKCATSQKTISLGKVRKLAPLTRYHELKTIIDSICATIK